MRPSSKCSRRLAALDEYQALLQNRIAGDGGLRLSVALADRAFGPG